MSASNINKRRERPKLGLDLDGVVFSFCIGCSTALKLRGVDIEIREQTHWNEIQELVPPLDWKWAWNEGVRKIFEQAPAFPGVATEVRKIQELMDIVVITHRPRVVADITLRKIADMGIKPIAVHIVQGEDKSNIDPGCVAYVDDKPSNVMDLSATGKPVFMPRKPWNEHLHYPSSYYEGRDIRPYDHIREVTSWVKQSVLR